MERFPNDNVGAMAGINPEGTMFLGLIDSLIDVVKDPAISRIEVIMSSYELDGDGKKKLVSGKHSIAQRAFVIRGMNKEVQDKLREQFDASPIISLMILWMERFQNENKMGVLTFDPATKQKTHRVSDYDDVEKSVIANYLQRQAK
jgi:hypothetical protein